MLWEETNLTENRASPSVISKISRSQRFSQKPKGSFTKFFCHVRKQFFDGKSRYSIIPPSPFSYPKYSSKPNFSQTRERFAYEFIRYCETKQFRRKIVIPPLLSLTFLDTRNVLKHRRVPLRNLLVLWDKKFLTGSRDNASPILSIRLCHTRSFLKSGRGPPRNFSVMWDKIFSTENLDTLLLPLTFLDLRIFLKNRKVPLRSFSVMWDNIFSTGNHDTPSFLHPPSHIQNVRRYQIFHKPGKGSLTNLLGTVRQNNFDGKSWQPLFYLQHFLIPEMILSTEDFL